jgi:hypothetical protein
MSLVPQAHTKTVAKRSINCSPKDASDFGALAESQHFDIRQPHATDHLSCCLNLHINAGSFKEEQLATRPNEGHSKWDQL